LALHGKMEILIITLTRFFHPMHLFRFNASVLQTGWREINVSVPVEANNTSLNFSHINNCFLVRSQLQYRVICLTTTLLCTTNSSVPILPFLLRKLNPMHQRPHASNRNFDAIARPEPLRRIHRIPDSRRRTRQDHAAGLQRGALAAELDDARDLKDHVRGVAVLAEFAVDAGLEGEGVWVWDFLPVLEMRRG
jgi:hypothetical protein